MGKEVSAVVHLAANITVNKIEMFMWEKGYEKRHWRVKRIVLLA